MTQAVARCLAVGPSPAVPRISIVARPPSGRLGPIDLSTALRAGIDNEARDSFAIPSFVIAVVQHWAVLAP